MKRVLTIKRLYSGTLLKIMLITGLFPWILIDTGIILLACPVIISPLAGLGFLDEGETNERQEI